MRARVLVETHGTAGESGAGHGSPAPAIQHCIVDKTEKRQLDEAPDRKWLAVMLDGIPGFQLTHQFGLHSQPPQPTLDGISFTYFHEVWAIAREAENFRSAAPLRRRDPNSVTAPSHAPSPPPLADIERPPKPTNSKTSALDAAVCALATTQVGNRLASVNAAEIIERFSADSEYDSVTLTLILHYKETPCELAVLGPGLAWLRPGGEYLAVDGDAIRGVLSYPCRLIAEAEGLMGAGAGEPQRSRRPRRVDRGRRVGCHGSPAQRGTRW